MGLAGWFCVWLLFAASAGSAQTSDGFTGIWKLNAQRSELRALPTPPSAVLKVEETPDALTVGAGAQETGPFTTFTYPLKNVEGSFTSGGSTMKTLTKWEGSALLVNTIVSGPQNYTIMERWKRSRDGGTLTIRRTIVRLSGETESTLVYENAVPVAKESDPEERRPTLDRPQPKTYTVQAGTHLLLRLMNTVNTKHSAIGDKVYLTTEVPVFVDRKLVIPRGSNVIGTITESKQAGKTKGRSALNVRFDSITLPNGVTRDLRTPPSSADGAGDLERSEGRIKGESGKGKDTRTVANTTAVGAGIGAIAGGGAGAGIGAAAGAVAGLAGVLGSRGPQVVLPEGSTMELTLDHDLVFTPSELPY